MDRLTHFFDAQRHYAKMSRLFFGLLFLVVALQLLIVLTVVCSITYVIMGKIEASIFFWVGLGVPIYLLIGMMISNKKIKEGGISIAKQAKAVRLFVYPDGDESIFGRDFIRVSHVSELPKSYQRYYEFANQMAISAGIPLPKLYVLPFEMGVNAFVAGFNEEDMVMVVTQGATEKLTNAELYGLLGHEFGHILHQDTKLNLRIYVGLMMLNWIYDSVDILEEKIFGKFDKNYHDSYAHLKAMKAPFLYSKEDWLDYISQGHYLQQKLYLGHHSYNKNSTQMMGAWFWVAAPLILFRLFGVWGMIGTEWIKKKFNHQREFLADATSVQLTRSPDVVKVLEKLGKRYHTDLQTHAFSTCMSHFFFADPKPKKEDYHTSHPDIVQRIDALKNHQFADAGRQAVVRINPNDLKQAHDFVAAYPSFQPIQEEILTQKISESTTPDVIEFTPTPEVVINGRLVVEQEHMKPLTKMIYPKDAKAHEIFPPDFDAKVIYLPYRILKKINLDWQISKNFNKVAMTISVIESVLLCQHYDAIQVGVSVDFDSIYTPRESCLTTNKTGTLCHRLFDETLLAIAKQDRRLDGLILLLAIRRLYQLYQQQAVNQTLLMRYSEGFLPFVEHIDDKYNRFHQTTFNQNIMLDKSWHANLHTISQSATILAVYQAVQAGMESPDGLLEQNAKPAQLRLFSWLGFQVDETNISDIAKVVLLALLGSVQDNSLELYKHEKLLQNIQRFCRLLQINQSVDDITLLYQVRALDVIDGLLILLAVQGDKKVFLETLYTALISDGTLGQKEYEFLHLLSLAFKCVLPQELT